MWPRRQEDEKKMMLHYHAKWYLERMVIINLYSGQPVDSPYAQELQDRPSKINAIDQPETTQHKKYRSRYDMSTTILKVASQKEANQTHIMYGAFMSYYQLRKYVAFLLNNGLLIKQQQQQPIYRLTEKGEHFLRLYAQLIEMIAELNDKRKK